MGEFEPRIIGFLCNWCSYAGADLTGVSRIQYPTNLRVIRVMCSGRVDPALPLGFLAEGADGVMITGCHIGDCHYIDGNLYAKRKFGLLRRLVEKAGLEPGRVMLEWVSASEGQKFADVVTGFTNKLKELGPTPVTGDEGLRLNLLAAKAAAEEFRLRALVSKEEKLVEKGNVYGELVTQEEFDGVLDEAVENEYTRNKIRLMLSMEPMSAKNLAEKMGMDSAKVLNHIVALRQRGWVDLLELQGNTPVYMTLEVA
ncbi:hydrogenase iron-sulfur subunit [Candidatus Bathyarchaeota archaeon]|nr:hydrogenase iron-sulfur subunit [Candidatus Bathyarchaeota archaeon]